MPIPSSIQTRLNNNGINNQMPAWTIINNAWLQPPAPGVNLPFGDPVPTALQKLVDTARRRPL